MKGTRNSACNLKSVNGRLVFAPAKSILCPPTFTSVNSSLFSPSNKTMAPSGGLASSVGGAELTAIARLHLLPPTGLLRLEVDILGNLRHELLGAHQYATHHRRNHHLHQILSRLL